MRGCAFSIGDYVLFVIRLLFPVILVAEEETTGRGDHGETRLGTEVVASIIQDRRLV